MQQMHRVLIEDCAQFFINKEDCKILVLQSFLFFWLIFPLIYFFVYVNIIICSLSYNNGGIYEKIIF